MKMALRVVLAIVISPVILLVGAAWMFLWLLGNTLMCVIAIVLFVFTGEWEFKPVPWWPTKPCRY